MRLLSTLYGVPLALAGVGTSLGAQSAGRPCNQELARLPAVTLSDVVDSGAVTEALRASADRTSPITKVVLLYDAYGQLSKITMDGTRSPAAEADLERQVRAAAKPVGLAMPSDYHFMATIVRLNRRDVIDISPFPLTCPPSQSMTSEAARLIRKGQGGPSGDAIVQLWLNANGDVVDAWIKRSAGRSELDGLALRIVRVLRFTAPVFGSTSVATLLQVPVRF